MTAFVQSGLKGKTKEDIVFDIVNFLILTGVTLVVLYPLYFVLIASFSNPDSIYAGEVWLFPKGFTLDGYIRIIHDASIWIGYRNSIIYAVLGTAISISMILPAAYALSRKDFAGRQMIMIFLIMTMFFDGGMIPTYLLVRDLGMLDTIWAMVLPSAIGLWNVIIARTFFETTIPDELREAAFIDGASNFQFFMKVVIPLSKPIIAVMVLIHVVGNWNMFFNALIYLNDNSLYPLQLILRNILIENQFAAQTSMLSGVSSYAEQQRIAELIKYGMIIISSLPLIILYPFLHKYFVKGMLIGAIKG